MYRVIGVRDTGPQINYANETFLLICQGIAMCCVITDVPGELQREVTEEELLMLTTHVVDVFGILHVALGDIQDIDLDLVKRHQRTAQEPMKAAELQCFIETAAELDINITNSLVSANEITLILTDEVTEEAREDLGAVELINVMFGDNIGISVGILVDHDSDLINKDGGSFGQILSHKDVFTFENIGVDLAGEPQGDV